MCIPLVDGKPSLRGKVIVDYCNRFHRDNRSEIVTLYILPACKDIYVNKEIPEQGPSIICRHSFQSTPTLFPKRKQFLL